ncbi:MAG: tRNA 2-thiouridine(34) synthase MnmA [Acidobacteria bacterium]|nr:MAG: tRNA 2-thiouridine(34) synthase MnmA [Acidobacteriota bacterium]
MKKKRVVVGLSGGVDSAVAALLLVQQGYDVLGVFMKNWEDDSPECTTENDQRDARLVADTLGIPFYTFNFVKEYWDRVFTYFLETYAAGQTPNPDILCNKEIKFKAYLEKAMQLDADFIATGHYARLARQANSVQLLKGIDPGKDQSYFLYAVPEKALLKSLFPLGNLMKTDVRQLAKSAGLHNWNRKDSVGICFIGERKFKTFLEGYLPGRKGDMVDLDGHVKARHDGLMFYTIGQRQGLGIGGPGAPWFVAAKNLKRNQLIVVQGADHPALFSKGLSCSDLFLINGEKPDLPFRCRAKIRYRQPDQDCQIIKEKNSQWIVRFDLPQKAVSPGQAIVFYRDDVCLGGAVIDRPIRDF